MNDENSSLLLLGIGGSGVNVVRRVRRAYGESLHAHITDTDAGSGAGSEIPFTLLGGDRLSGHGAGGNSAAAREAFRDNPAVLDSALNGVRVCVTVLSLGGGTANGAAIEILKRMRERGIATIAFATLPFAFEGTDRVRAARSARSSLESAADVPVFLPLDDLVKDAPSDNMKEALSRANDTLATALTFFWRLLEKPGYIRLEAEHIRAALRDAGRARFAVATASGPDRAREALVRIRSSRLIAQDDAGPVSSILLGVLAGDDLRLSEISLLADGVRSAFGEKAAFRLGTVNDEETFSGRLTAILLVFSRSTTAPAAALCRKAQDEKAALGLAPSGFTGADPTMYGNVNLDVPTYLRRELVLDR